MPSSPTSGIDWGVNWLTDHGVADPAARSVRFVTRTALEAADCAYQDPDRLLAVDGIGAATVDQLADLSPLDPPGEWAVTKHGPGEYTFHAGAATLSIAPVDGGATTAVDYDGDKPLLRTWRVEQDGPEESALTAWWAVRDVLERNPQGPGSDVPPNVPVPADWRLCSYPGPDVERCCAWERRGPFRELKVVQDGGEFVLYDVASRTEPPEAATRGAWADLLDRAGEMMAADAGGDR